MTGTTHRVDATLADGDRIEVGSQLFAVRRMPPHYSERESDERLAALAEKAWRAGLISGRAVVRPMSREALVERLCLVIVERRRPRASNEVTFEESDALRIAYGAAHKASSRTVRR